MGSCVVVITFLQVFEALTSGQRVRQDRWDDGSELFVEDNQLIMLAHGGKSNYVFDWRDMNRTDWRILA